MKLEPCIILNLFLNYSDSESYYSYKLYSYKTKSVYLSGEDIIWDFIEKSPQTRQDSKHYGALEHNEQAIYS